MNRSTHLFVVLLAGCAEWFLPEPPPEDAYLVWQRTPDGLQTTWLNNVGESLSEHPGLVLSWGGGLWRLQQSSSSHPSLDCSCVMSRSDPFSEDAPSAECMQDSTIETATLLGPSAFSLPILTVPVSQSWQSDQQQSLTIRGSLGPYLLYAIDRSSYACGAAHGTSTSSFHVLDLRAPEGGALSLDVLLPDLELGALAPDLLEGARSRLVSEEGDESGLLDPSASPSLTALSTSWTSTGLQVSAQVTFEVCYACGDGQWSAYTRSEQHLLGVVPAALAEHVTPLPAAVSSWAQDAGVDDGWGYSVYTGTPEALAAARSSLP